jgi:hypothetical protein
LIELVSIKKIRELKADDADKYEGESYERIHKHRSKISQARLILEL